MHTPSFRFRNIPMIVCTAVLLALAPDGAGTAAPPPDGPPDVTTLGLLSEHRGILVVEGRLFLTDDRGQSWEERTPPGGAAVLAADFLPDGTGWAVLSPNAPPAPLPELQLATTMDSGLTWALQPLTVPTTPSDPPVSDAALSLDGPDAAELMLRFASSSNFHLGAQFRTHDGGRSWTRMPLPEGTPEDAPGVAARWPEVGAPAPAMARLVRRKLRRQFLPPGNRAPEH